MDLIYLNIDFNSIVAQRFRVNQYFKTIKLIRRFDFTDKDLKRIIIDIPWTIDVFQKILVNLGFGADLKECCGNIDKKIIISAPANLICGQEKIYICEKSECWRTLVKEAKKEIKNDLSKEEQKLLGMMVEWTEFNGYRVKGIELQEDHKLKEKTKIGFYYSYTSDIYFELIREVIKELNWQSFKVALTPNLYLLTESILNKKKNTVVILIDNNFFEVNVIVDNTPQPIWFGRINQITDLNKKITDYLTVLEKEQGGLLPAMFGRVFFRGCYTELEIKNKIITPLVQSGYFLDFSSQTIRSAKQNIEGKVINNLNLRYV